MLLSGRAASAAVTLILPVPDVVESVNGEPGPLPRNDLPQRLSAVPGAAHHGPVHPALVRRHARRLERLPAVLPSRAAGRIRVRALAAPIPADSHRAPGRIAGASSRDPHPAGDHRHPVRTDSAAAGGHRRRAVLPPLGHGSPVAEMVSSVGTIAVAPLRAVELRIVPGAAELSVPGRALCAPANAGLGLVGTSMSCSRSCADAVAWASRPAVASGQKAGPTDAGPTLWTILFWLGLSAAGSTLLLATTNIVTQDVAVSPFLWIAPLSLYLLTFRPRLRKRPLVSAAAVRDRGRNSGPRSLRRAQRGSGNQLCRSSSACTWPRCSSLA